MLNEGIKANHRNVEPNLAEHADVREDEEQGVKCNEIIEALVLAGYFRAQIKGLSNFDKVVGGLTWCIESCNFDVDVDLLFHENLTIGQKIALTEKIVIMLPKMNCPHLIEPHQIQGLDYIHIFPVIQWLIKRSIETRRETAGFVRSYALNQYNKIYLSSGKKNTNGNNQIVTILRRFYPRRKFKMLDQVECPKDEIIRIKCTLLEYENSMIPGVLIPNSGNQSIDNDNVISQSDDESLDNDIVGGIVNLNIEEVAKISKIYVAPLPDTKIQSIDDEKISNMLDKQKEMLNNQLQKCIQEKKLVKKNVSDVMAELKRVEKGMKSLEEEFIQMKALDNDKNKRMLETLEELLKVHMGLKDQEHKFREQCKADASYLQKIIQNMETLEPQEEQNRLIEFDSLKESINKNKLTLAKKNRAIASLIRQLDDVPGRSELTQYQRRFMELYNQVSAKHKETKQYYTLYNTLDDTKLYLSKELSLLNSIQENYNEAMASASGKEQFLKQFEIIIAGVKRNKEKVEKKWTEEKERKFNLNKQLVGLMEQQRKYVAAVRQLTIECRKNETLLSQLRAL